MRDYTVADLQQLHHMRLLACVAERAPLSQIEWAAMIWGNLIDRNLATEILKHVADDGLNAADPNVDPVKYRDRAMETLREQAVRDARFWYSTQETLMATCARHKRQSESDH